MFVDGDEGSLTEIKFEKCKDGLTLFRNISVRARSAEPEVELQRPLSPQTRSREIHVLTEVVNCMAGMRMDEQRCFLKKDQDQGQSLLREEIKRESKSELIDMIQSVQVRESIKRGRGPFIFGTAQGQPVFSILKDFVQIQSKLLTPSN